MARTAAQGRAGAALGRRMVLAAEDAYAAAGELDSDGRWLSTDLDELGRLLARNTAPRGGAPRSTAGPAPDVCATLPRPAEDVCAGERRGGRVNASECTARALGRRVGAPCRRRRVDRWRIVAGVLMPSERSGVREGRVVRGGKGTAWELLLGPAPVEPPPACRCAYGTCERCLAAARHDRALRALRAFGDGIAAAVQAMRAEVVA
jgi:hypothetical protein